MRSFVACLIGAAALLVEPALAQDSPEALVRSVTDEVIDIVKRDKDIQAGDRRKSIALIEQKVLPHFGFQRMTALAMGANWRKATPDQQKTLVDQFRTLLVRTYSSALSAYHDQVIEVKPVHMQPGDSDVTVRSEIKQPGAAPITIDYSMGKTPAGWKVYDVAVGGASLVTTYRDTFAAEVRSGGIDGLIKSLAQKNHQLATRSG